MSNQKSCLVNAEEPVTAQLTKQLSVRLYEDCSPHCMETASIQKGIVLMLDGEELIEEGLGFGVPVVKYRDKTYFSSSAEISIMETPSVCKLSKRYVMDAISRKKFGQTTYIDDGFYSSIRKTFEKAYLAKKSMSPFFNAIMELRQMAKVRTEFIKVKDRGSVTLNYEIYPTYINVNVDFSALSKEECAEILVLNEQGAAIFEKYVDASGLKLHGRKIGAWDAVVANFASLFNFNGELSFSLQKIPEAALFRGWERTRNRFSWAGLSYSVSPSHGTLNYTIGLISSRHLAL
ncbi:MAG: hypothetical protein ABSF44_02530 [Candidatus Bathyarchaeia archaeon]